MAVDVAKAVYIVVVDGGAAAEEKEEVTKHSFRYTRPVLQSTLQLMGCKPRHAFKMSQRVFKMIPVEFFEENLVTSGESELGDSDSKVHPVEEADVSVDRMNGLILSDCWHDNNTNPHFKTYKKRTTAVVDRKTFLDVVCMALTEYKYVSPNQRDDLALACRLRERKESVTVLLCGTSGCGKSTLSALLASRLGITTVISTDSIRHMMRSFVDEKQNPLLWASTYHAGEYLDPLAVAEAKAKRKAKKSVEFFNQRIIKNDGVAEKSTAGKEKVSSLEVSTPELIGPKQMAVEGFKAQGEMVIESLDRLITTWEERKESVVVEGVHLSLNFVMGLMKKHPSIIPFMIYIANEEKHMERFAVRAKYMTLDPAKNKYVKYIRNIRTIQEYLCKRADKHLVPKINNTNVDRSVAAIHATVFSCLRRRGAGEQLYDPMTNTVAMVDEEYKSQLGANSLSSKGMFQLIQRQGSSNHMMALLNHDGSVAKAWPVNNSIEVNGIGTPMYGPLQISKYEPVNLQFGNFGISAWPSDIGCTSRASSVDESRGDATDNCSLYYSSSYNSPRLIPEGHAKKMKEEEFVYGSDEELDELPETGSDEDRSDDERQSNEEMEGSVDESNNTDEEYDDLAIQETGYFSDENEEFCINGTLKQPLKEDKDMHEGGKKSRGEISISSWKPTMNRKLQPPVRSDFTI